MDGSPMKTYTFFLQQGSDATPAFEIEMFADRAAAIGFAEDLLAERRRYDRVVVTEDEDEIARVERRERRQEPRQAAG